MRQWVALTAALAFFALFLAAGVWQWRRAMFKEQLFAAWAALPAQPEVPLETALAAVGPEHLAKARLRGRWLQDRNILLDNQTRDRGRIGVAVFSALALEGRPEAILVHRGFADVPRDRSRFPDPPLPSGPVEIAGILARPPASGLRLATAAQPERWPLLVTAIEPASLSPALGTPLLPSVLLLDDARSDGLERDWRPQTLPPDRHRGYAVQWFGLAATVLVVTVLLTVRQARRSRS